MVHEVIEFFSEVKIKYPQSSKGLDRVYKGLHYDIIEIKLL
jgi:hypothetical protein